MIVIGMALAGGLGAVARFVADGWVKHRMRTRFPVGTLLINLRDAAPTGSFERVLEVVPADPAARGPLRERWKHYQTLGFEVNKHDM